MEAVNFLTLYIFLSKTFKVLPSFPNFQRPEIILLIGSDDFNNIPNTF